RAGAFSVDQRVAGLGDGGAHRLVVERRAGDGQAAGLQVDVDAVDAVQLADLLAHRGDAVPAGHPLHGVGPGLAHVSPSAVGVALSDTGREYARSVLARIPPWGMIGHMATTP